MRPEGDGESTDRSLQPGFAQILRLAFVDDEQVDVRHRQINHCLARRRIQDDARARVVRRLDRSNNGVNGYLELQDDHIVRTKHAA